MIHLAAAVAGVVFVLSAPITAGVVRPRPLSIVFEISDDYSAEAFEEKMAVLASLMKDAGFVIDFQALRQIKESDVFADLVVVRFRGRCRMDLPPPPKACTGILALVHSTDRTILPFVEVACDHVRAVVQFALRGRVGHADLLYGRALARVVAHELYHIAARTLQHAHCSTHIAARTFRHGHRGITKPSLSGYELISDDLGFSAEELEALRRPSSLDRSEPEVPDVHNVR